MKKVLFLIITSVMLLGLIMKGAFGFFSDAELSAGSTFAGWVPIEWIQTLQSHFAAGALSNVDIIYYPGDVRLATTDGHNYLYAFRGDDKKDFWGYDIAADSWSSLADAPDKVKEGGALTHDGNNYIYALQGKDKKKLWRYDIVANSWSSLADAPDKVRYGGALAYDGNNYLYAFRGDDKKDFWGYDIAADSWSSLADAPDKVKEGGALTHDGNNYIYALQGKDKKKLWRYDIVANSWSSLADAPDKVRYGGALAFVPGSSYYVTSGTIASQVLDTEISGARWSGLSWSETLQSGTDITLEVRASDTQFAKSDVTPSWTAVGGTSPVESGLPGGRYMQWRATLTTSESDNSPVLRDVTINYY